MNIELDRKNPTDASIKITLNEADYQPEVNKKIKTYSKQITLKGFRPGKVPPAIVKRMYGKSILVEEINGLLQKSLYDYIKESDLRVVGEPLPNYDHQQEIDWENQKDFEFVFDLGIVPDFEYKPESLTITQYEIAHDEEKFQELLDSLKKQYGETIRPETVEEGDFVYGNLKELTSVQEETNTEDSGDGEEVAEVLPFEKEVLIPLNQVSEAEQSRFMNLKAEDVVTFSIQDLFEDGAKALSMAIGITEEEAAELQGEFEFTLDNITRTTPAEMNPEFFQQVLGPEAPETEEEFLERVKDYLSQNNQSESDRYFNTQIIEESLANTEVELPSEFLKRWMLSISNDDGIMTTEELDNQYENFSRTLKWSLIRNNILKGANLKLEEGEVEARARQMIASQFGGHLPQDSALMEQFDSIVNNYLEAEDGRNYDQIADQVLEEKALVLLKDQVQIEMKSVSREEFEEILQKTNS